MIVVVDYGVNNLASVVRAIRAAGHEATLATDPAVVRGADRVVVPGVGNFTRATHLARSGLADAIRDVAASGRPLLGICLGLQLLYESSEEAPDLEGLAVYPGKVVRFPADYRVPHMGWNELELQGSPRLLADVGEHPYVYFAHSFYVPADVAGPRAAALCEYGFRYAAALESGNEYKDIFGSPPTKFSKTNHLATTITSVQQVLRGRWVMVQDGLTF